MMMMVDGVGDNDHKVNSDDDDDDDKMSASQAPQPTLRSDFQVSWRIWLAGRLMEDTKLSIGSAAGQQKPKFMFIYLDGPNLVMQLFAGQI